MCIRTRALRRRCRVCPSPCEGESITKMTFRTHNQKSATGAQMSQKVSANKSAKEIAFLQDLFVAPDWGERFAELIDEHVPLPEKGNALYLAVGTGSHALALQERAGAGLKFLCIDENEECLELARAKATALKEPAEFRQGTLEPLQLTTDQFDLVLGDGSLVATERVPAV